MTSRERRLGVVGAGIVGLAQAWSAAERGWKVTIFERSPFPQGGSVRNFGMVWPIGQPAGPRYRTALRSRERWSQLAHAGAIWHNPYGSLHVAHREDEWAVLTEFAALAPGLGVTCELLSAEAVAARSPGVRRTGLLGGLFSPTEIAVNPPEAVRALPAWLARQWGVESHFQTAVIAVEPGRLRTADGRHWEFDEIVVCSGPDFETLFPEQFARSGLKRCKLQMLRTVPQPSGWQLGCHLASGLTLRHYEIFEVCPALAALRERIAREQPELDRYGIHVMASQTNTGALILGDSHEYDAAIDLYDQAEIDDLILRELRQIFDFPDWTIAARWHGVYAKTPGQPVFVTEPCDRVRIVTGTGGGGMTMSFGIAEDYWETRE